MDWFMRWEMSFCVISHTVALSCEQIHLEGEGGQRLSLFKRSIFEDRWMFPSSSAYLWGRMAACYTKEQIRPEAFSYLCVLIFKLSKTHFCLYKTADHPQVNAPMKKQMQGGSWSDHRYIQHQFLWLQQYSFSSCLFRITWLIHHLLVSIQGWFRGFMRTSLKIAWPGSEEPNN